MMKRSVVGSESGTKSIVLPIRRIGLMALAMWMEYGGGLDPASHSTEWLSRCFINEVMIGNE